MGGPLRILHVVVNMNRGGAETLLMNMYRHIDRSNVQFDFLTCKEGVFDEEIRSLGGIIYRIPHITEVGYRSYMKGLERFFVQHAEYKVIHSHMDKMSGFVLRAASRAAIPVRIAHSHNTRSEGSVPARLFKWYAGTLVESAATHYVACSSAAATWMFPRNKKKSTVLPNGIASEQFAFSIETRSRLRRELNIPEDCLVVGHVGRFAHQKNHTQLIDMFCLLQNKKPNSLLVLVGDGPLRTEIERKVSELQLDHKVMFLGVRSNINEMMQAFDAFVFPSHHEGLGIVVIEAQGAGLPCIISEHIPAEVDMGIGLVQFFSLKQVDSGVDHIIAAAPRGAREIPEGALAQKGYDIRQTARQATELYLSQFEVTNEDANRVYAHV
ncbi:glycosyltransferase family 1 protein [Paenibacillus sinopodophylli]|uniref:glycosyltransferase family 1 protein n=1 Tax=Paenibacillus sinopodophylli TaxID=1837342 RepID=UPI00110D0247|nr:glycosyltransferase family 1 protein [Paenibacillus sinopodophylli]